jgi:DNA-binding XRE family transcriptional regulator
MAVINYMVAGQFNFGLIQALQENDADAQYAEYLMAFRADLIHQLIQLRKEAGLTREHLAMLLGTTEDAVKRIETDSGYSSITMDRLFRWAWVCGMVTARMAFMDRNEVQAALLATDLVP